MTSSRGRHEIIAALEELTRNRGFIYSLVVMLRRDLFLDLAKAAEIDWQARLSFQEFSFLAGLLVKRPLDLSYPSASELQAHMREAWSLFDELHHTHGAKVASGFQQALERTDGDDLAAEKAFPWRGFIDDRANLLQRFWCVRLPVLGAGSGAVPT